MIRQCRFIIDNKYTNPVGNVDSSGGYACAEGRIYIESILSAQFCPIPETTLKNSLKSKQTIKKPVGQG